MFSLLIPPRKRVALVFRVCRLPTVNQYGSGVVGVSVNVNLWWIATSQVL